MVTSHIAEEEWLRALADAPAMTVLPASVVILAPHPDDETLATGGLIAALGESGCEVRVLAVTDGERAYGEADEMLARTRQVEQEAALGVLGVGAWDIVRLGLPDSRLHECEPALVEEIVKVLRPDTTLVAPWPRDWHSDHEACGRAAAVAAQRTGAKVLWWFWWSWHQRGPEDLSALRLCKLPLRDEWRERKLAALAEHRSQLGENGQILPDALLRPAKRPFEVFAESAD